MKFFAGYRTWPIPRPQFSFHWEGRVMSVWLEFGTPGVDAIAELGVRHELSDRELDALEALGFC